MWLFKEIINEVLKEGRYSTEKKTGGVFDTGENPTRSYIIFGGNKQPIYSLGEMAKEFRENYLSDETGAVSEATRATLMEAYERGFFKRWIPTKTINQAMGISGRPNKGNALEYILGKKQDSKSESDLVDAELKSYDEGVYYHGFFDLSPYNFKHFDPDTMKSEILVGDAQVNKVLAQIKSKINKTKKQDRLLNTDKFTDYQSMPNRSFARAIIEVDKTGTSRFKNFSIETEFYGTDAKGRQIPMDRLSSTYSVDDAEEQILYHGRRGGSKQTISQTIGNKLLTVISFPTVSLHVENKYVQDLMLIPGDKTIYNEFYMYTTPSVHSIMDLGGEGKELALNFIEGINNGDIVVSFGFDENLKMKTQFKIKNDMTAYDNIYRRRDDTRIVAGEDEQLPNENVEIVPLWTNHNWLASQNSIDQGYEYVGELHDENSGVGADVVSKNKYDDSDSMDMVYNIENENEELVFPVWFDDFETWNEVPEKDKVLLKDNDALIIGHYNGKRYLLNWVTGEIGNIE